MIPATGWESAIPTARWQAVIRRRPWHRGPIWRDRASIPATTRGQVMPAAEPLTPIEARCRTPHARTRGSGSTLAVRSSIRARATRAGRAIKGPRSATRAETAIRVARNATRVDRPTEAPRSATRLRRKASAAAKATRLPRSGTRLRRSITSRRPGHRRRAIAAAAAASPAGEAADHEALAVEAVRIRAAVRPTAAATEGRAAGGEKGALSGALLLVPGAFGPLQSRAEGVAPV